MIIVLISPFICKGQAKVTDTIKLYFGTNSIAIGPTRYPLNTLILDVKGDSSLVGITNINTQGVGYNSGVIVKPRPFYLYKNGVTGVSFPTFSNLDSFYEKCFVK